MRKVRRGMRRVIKGMRTVSKRGYKGHENG